MSSSLHEIYIRIRDEATKWLQSIQSWVNGMLENIERHKEGIQAIGTVSGVAFAGLTGGIVKAVGEANKLENALMGLESIVVGTGGNFEEAKKKIQEFTADGLIGIDEASLALKNLLARGYGQDEALALMSRIKDAAAYGRQAGLSLGEAVVTATEGLKNENSILVDNAGITKNVAKMWEDYAKQIGKSTKDLTDAEKRQAEINGIMEETKFQIGDAEKVSKTFSGTLLRVQGWISTLFAEIGATVKPVLNDLLVTIEPIIAKITTWITNNQELAGKILLVATAVTGIIAVMAGLALAIWPIVSGISLLGTIIGALISPIGLVIAAIVALGVAYTTNFMGFKDIVDSVVGWISAKLWEFVAWITDIFNNSWLAETFKNIWDSAMIAVDAFVLMVKDFLQGLSDFWAEWGDTIMEIVDNLWSLVGNAFSTAIDSIIDIFQWAIEIFVGIFDVFAGLFTGNWSQLWDGIVGIFSGIFGTIWDIFNNIVTGILNFVDHVFGTNLRASWEKIWNGLTDFIRNIFNGEALSAAGEALWNIANKALEWGANMIEMFKQGVQRKWGEFKAWVSESAGVLADFFGFHSPTKKWPNSDADKWMPNFIKMLTDGIKAGKWDLENSVEHTAKAFAKINKWLKVDEIKRAFKQMQKDAEQAFDSVASDAEKSKKKIEKFKDEIEKISEKIQNMKNKMEENDDDFKVNISDRYFEVLEKLEDYKNDKNISAKDERERGQLEEELKLIQTLLTAEEIQSAEIAKQRSETQKMLDAYQLKQAKLEGEIQKQQNLQKEKEQALKDEEDLYKQLMQTKTDLENEYFSLFQQNLDKTKSGIQSAISMMQTLRAMGGNASANDSSDGGLAFGGAFASGGSVSVGKQYLVGERWPELFVPSANGYIVPNNQLGGGATININMGSVVVQNEADENRLAEKISQKLAKEARLYKLGIA